MTHTAVLRATIAAAVFGAGACVPGLESPNHVGDIECTPQCDAVGDAADPDESSRDTTRDDAWDSAVADTEPDPFVADTPPEEGPIDPSEPIQCATSAGCPSGQLCVASFCREECPPGRAGPACELACPISGSDGAVCSGHGDCDDGRFGTGACQCGFGYAGPACAELQPVQYRIVTRTGNEPYGGTNGNVELRLHGLTRSSAWLQLDGYGDDFVRGKRNTFYFTLGFIGPIERISLRMRPESDGECCDDWLVDSVEIADPVQWYVFDVDAWLTDDVRELEAP